MSTPLPDIYAAAIIPANRAADGQDAVFKRPRHAFPAIAAVRIRDSRHREKTEQHYRRQYRGNDLAELFHDNSSFVILDAFASGFKNDYLCFKPPSPKCSISALSSTTHASFAAIRSTESASATVMIPSPS